MLPDDQRQATYREAFRAYLHAHAPRTQNGLLIINRELLEDATAAGHEAVASAEVIRSYLPSEGHS